jgi:hypothetical protein
VIAPMILKTLPDESLVGMEQVALVSMVLALCVPPMLFIVERGVRAKAAAQAQTPGAPGGAVALTPSSSPQR